MKSITDIIVTAPVEVKGRGDAILIFEDNKLLSDIELKILRENTINMLEKQKIVCKNVCSCIFDYDYKKESTQKNLG